MPIKMSPLVSAVNAIAELTQNLLRLLDLTEAYLKIPLPQGMGVFMQAQYDNETNELIEGEIVQLMKLLCLYRLSASKRTLRRFSDVNSLNNMFLNENWGNIIDLENKSRINLNFEFKGFNSKTNCWKTIKEFDI